MHPNQSQILDDPSPPDGDYAGHFQTFLRTMVSINHLIFREREVERLLPAICQALIEGRGYYNSWIALFDRQGGLLFHAEAGLDDGFEPMLAQLREGNLPSCARSALVGGGVRIITNPYEDCSNCSLSINYRDRSGMAVRLEHAGRIFGLLTVSVPREFRAQKEEQELFAEVAGDIGYALYNMELENERRRAEEQLKKFSLQLEGKVRELNCLYQISEITSNQSDKIEDVLTKVISQILKSIPNANNTRIFLRWEDHTFEVGSYDGPAAIISSSILVADKKCGELLILRAIDTLHCYEGQTTREQQAIYNEIARKIGRFIELRYYEKKIAGQSVELLKSQERERMRVVQDLHDGVGQTLSAAKLNLALYRKQPRKNKSQLETGLHILDVASRELREVYNNLYPSILDDLGLQAAVECYIRNFPENSNFRPRVSIDLNRKLPHEVELHLYRIIQEALSNAVRHARAARIELSLSQQDDGSLALHVADNGIGFQPEEKKIDSGFGLENIRHRVADMQGNLEILARPGDGTRISITIPPVAL